MTRRRSIPLLFILLFSGHVLVAIVSGVLGESGIRRFAVLAAEDFALAFARNLAAEEGRALALLLDPGTGQDGQDHGWRRALAERLRQEAGRGPFTGIRIFDAAGNEKITTSAPGTSGNDPVGSLAGRQGPTIRHIMTAPETGVFLVTLPPGRQGPAAGTIALSYDFSLPFRRAVNWRNTAILEIGAVGLLVSVVVILCLLVFPAVLPGAWHRPVRGGRAARGMARTPGMTHGEGRQTALLCSADAGLEGELRRAVALSGLSLQRIRTHAGLLDWLEERGKPAIVLVDCGRDGKGRPGDFAGRNWSGMSCPVIAITDGSGIRGYGFSRVFSRPVDTDGLEEAVNVLLARDRTRRDAAAGQDGGMNVVSLKKIRTGDTAPAGAGRTGPAVFPDDTGLSARRWAPAPAPVANVRRGSPAGDMRLPERVRNLLGGIFSPVAGERRRTRSPHGHRLPRIVTSGEAVGGRRRGEHVPHRGTDRRADATADMPLVAHPYRPGGGDAGDGAGTVLPLPLVPGPPVPGRPQRSGLRERTSAVPSGPRPDGSGEDRGESRDDGRSEGDFSGDYPEEPCFSSWEDADFLDPAAVGRAGEPATTGGETAAAEGGRTVGPVLRRPGLDEYISRGNPFARRPPS